MNGEHSFSGRKAIEALITLRGNAIYLFAFLLVCFYFQTQSFSAEQNEEQQLIRLLKSNASPREKDAACARLKRIGTEQSIPALAALLTDEQLSHSARYALESMPYPKAGAALVDALQGSTGLTRLGLINSLAVRRDAQAVPALVQLLAAERKAPASLDEEAAISAAAALGEIATPAGISALELAAASSSGIRHAAIADALLRSANHLLASGKDAEALALFTRIPGGTNEAVLLAAQIGILRASGASASHRFAEALTGPAGPKQTAALQLIRETRFDGASQRFAELLPKLSPQVQVSLIEGLRQRDDPVAAPAIASLARAGESAVRVAALQALGPLGNETMVPLLAEAAASENSDAVAAARQALIELHRGQVTEALIAQMTSAKAEVQAELARALGQRADTAAVPKLLQLAGSEAEFSRAAALQALGLLAGQQDIGALIQLVTNGRTEPSRSQAAETLNATLQRLQSRNRSFDLTTVVKALENGSADVRISLLPVCSGLNDPNLRLVLHQAITDSTPAVRAAAIRALCDTRDHELLPDVLKLATAAPEENFRALATATCVRLVSQDEGGRMGNEARVAAMKALLASNPNAAQKRMVLAGLAEIPDETALSLAEPLLDEAAFQAEAAQAVIKISPNVGDSGHAIKAIKKVVGLTDGATRQAAEAALKQIEARADFLTNWQVSGPYRQAGKDYAALFDIAFPPEPSPERSSRSLPGSNSPEPNAAKDAAETAKWRPLPPGSDPARPGVMDLLKHCGGEQCVAYARTRIYSPLKQAALLELGTDDGVKVWVNEQLVHGNNVARPLQPGSDKISVQLNEGWNSLLLKVTQNDLAWEFCARLLKPDGSHLEGLRLAGP